MHRSSLLLLLVLPCLSVRAAELYRLDSANTRVSLDVLMFGFAHITARFDEISGELAPGLSVKPGAAAAAATAGRVDVTIRTASLKCDNTRWNARLLSSTWFDAERYPEIVYRSDRIDFDAYGRPVVSGHLTLHGQTRDLVLSVNRWVCPEGARPTDTCSFDAHGRLRRSDYDLPHGLFEGGDEVEISIEGVNAGPLTTRRDAAQRSLGWQVRR
jgi:polyisoprenoid-binding protein YceI